MDVLSDIYNIPLDLRPDIDLIYIKCDVVVYVKSNHKFIDISSLIWSEIPEEGSLSDLIYYKFSLDQKPYIRQINIGDIINKGKEDITYRELDGYYGGCGNYLGAQYSKVTSYKILFKYLNGKLLDELVIEYKRLNNLDPNGPNGRRGERGSSGCGDKMKYIWVANWLVKNKYPGYEECEECLY